MARHIERAAATAYQAYRRARWLQLLHDCDVTFREPESAASSSLHIRDGWLAAATSGAARAQRARAPAHFDRAKYDRLRVLTTELKRIVRDGGAVSVHWGDGRCIPERRLPGVLQLV